MATKSEQKIYLALGVLAALSAGLFVQQRSNRTEAMAHSQAGAVAALPEIKVPADDLDKLTSITIKNAAKGEVTLEKTGDKWMVTKPVSYLANQQNVKSLLDNLKELKLKDTIDPGKDQYATYDLDDGKAVHVEAFKGKDQAADLYFGKSGSRGQMTRVGGKDGVYVATGYSSYLYGREVKNWRDTEIIKLEEANVVSVGITNEHGTFSFSKNDDKWTGTFKKAAIANFDPEKVKDLVRAYKTLNAEDFGDGKSAEETGLGKPDATVELTLKDNGGTFKVAVGKTATGSSRYLQKDGNPTVFIISSWAADWATAAESKFQKVEAKDGGAPDAGKATTAKK